MEITLSSIPPYDFDLSTAIFSGGDEQVRQYKNGIFSQVIRINGKLVLIKANSTGNIEAPRIRVELVAKERTNRIDQKEAETVLRSMLSADLDLKPFYTAVNNDKVMSNLINRLNGLKSPVTETPFEALIDSVIEQQISLNVAHHLQNNMIKRFGESLDLNSKTYYAYPTPRELKEASIEGLRGCGLSSRKAEYVKDISGLVYQGKLDLAQIMSYDDSDKAVAELDKIRGIGLWTAELTLVRGMGKLEAIPADDIGVRRAISHYYFKDRRIASEEARQIAESWGKWKGLASFYLIMAEIKRIPV